MDKKTLTYQIALTLIPGIGPIASKKLIAYCGGAEAVLKEKKSFLMKIPGIGEIAAKTVANANTIQQAEQEIEFLEKNNMEAHFYLSKSYPQRLVHAEDSPIILYTKGNVNLNPAKVVSIVGTRKATVKGKAITEKLVEELKPYNPLIVSGLAYGIDIVAHKSAINHQLATLGILACGLDEIYPKSHFSIVEKMMNNGGIATDYRSGTKLYPKQFAERNRIVAGMADAIIVIESSEKGGSLITADLGNGYNRDVFAVPGRIDDSQSVGCNRLIKQNKAALIESVKDIEYIMGWKSPEGKKEHQVSLFVELTADEQLIYDELKSGEAKALDEISLTIGFPISKTASLLLGMEFKNLLRSLPGKMYQLV